MSDDSDLYETVFANNRAWVAGRTTEDPEFFERLASEQHPEFLYIGCSDSRIPANEIMGLAPGQVFVHRNVANLVVNTDSNCQAVIEFAVEHLRVKHVVVCGHYGCGGVTAAMRSADLGQLNGWLREVRDVYRLHMDELDAIDDKEAQSRRLVELNVQEQCINVIKVASVQRHWLRTGFPTVHGWIYDMRNGLLRDLDIPFETVLENIRRIYRLEVD